MNPASRAHPKPSLPPWIVDPTAPPGADAGGGAHADWTTLHPEGINSRRARNPPNRHPPRVPAARVGELPGRRREAPEPRGSAINTARASANSRITSQHEHHSLSPSSPTSSTPETRVVRRRVHHVWDFGRPRLRRLVAGQEGSRPLLLPQASTCPALSMHLPPSNP